MPFGPQQPSWQQIRHSTLDVSLIKFIVGF